MQKLIVFTNITLDGYYAAEDGDISWAQKGSKDPEWKAFVEENAKGGGALMFGRATYEMMASFWPTPMGKQFDPVVAERMNQLPKFVVSKTLKSAAWNNTQVVAGDLAKSIKALKEQPGKGIAVLGSGSLVPQLASAGLVDEFQFVINPVALGAGKKLFAGLAERISLTLTKSRSFKNGNVLLCYQPAA